MENKYFCVQLQEQECGALVGVAAFSRGSWVQRLVARRYIGWWFVGVALAGSSVKWLRYTDTDAMADAKASVVDVLRRGRKLRSQFMVRRPYSFFSEYVAYAALMFLLLFVITSTNAWQMMIRQFNRGTRRRAHHQRRRVPRRLLRSQLLYAANKSRRKPPATPGQPFVTSLGSTLQWIPPGELLVPAQRGQREYLLDNKYGFWLGRYEVTQHEYIQAIGRQPSKFKGNRRPVEGVEFAEALQFCELMTRMEQHSGRTPGFHFALPTKLQWEYACRAKTTTPYHFGETISAAHQANYDGRYPPRPGVEQTGPFRNETTRVGSFPSNAFGLHDMHGNVREWCADDLGSPVYRATRGGGWWDKGKDCAVNVTQACQAVKRSSEVGFRLALIPVDGATSAAGEQDDEEDVPFVVLVLMLLIPAVGLLYLVLTQRARQLNRVFARFAHLYKGEVVAQAGYSSYPSVAFAYRGIKVELDFFPSGPPHNEVFTCLTFHLSGVLQDQRLRLEVTPLSLKDFRQARFRGMEALDKQPPHSPLRSVVVTTNDMPLLKELLGKGLDERIAALDVVGGIAPTYLSLNSQRLVIKKMKLFYSLQQLRDFVLAAFAFIDALIEHYDLAVSPEDFVIIGHDGAEFGGTGDGNSYTVGGAVSIAPVCEICGTDICGEAAVCDNCDTPHHVDCWQYNGACCTFACGCHEYSTKTIVVATASTHEHAGREQDSREQASSEQG